MNLLSEVNCGSTTTDLMPGRIFTGDDETIYNVNFMQYDTVYYVDEGQGVPTHTLCDLFFCTNQEELVLIDVTGGNTS